MGRLVDVDKLFSERPEYRNPIHGKNGDFNKGWNACVDTFCDVIKEQPTAYDMDKVLEELNKEQELWLRGYNQTLAMGLEHMWRNLSGRAYGVAQAIAIVNRGGIDE